MHKLYIIHITSFVLLYCTLIFANCQKAIQQDYSVLDTANVVKSVLIKKKKSVNLFCLDLLVSFAVF